VKKPQRQTGFYWVSAHGEEFEPAKVNYKNGKPINVCFAGWGNPFDVDQCVIRDPVIKPKELQ